MTVPLVCVGVRKGFLCLREGQKQVHVAPVGCLDSVGNLQVIPAGFGACVPINLILVIASMPLFLYRPSIPAKHCTHDVGFHHLGQTCGA